MKLMSCGAAKILKQNFAEVFFDQSIMRKF